ncbi:MAG: glycosyltransferase family 39 protein [Saprospirales bacterium]|nr:glycosyltransferase family 39 protein [Saprospirales bacterium]
MTRSTRILLILFGLLLLPALLTNLGLMTFIDDEAIRSLVALEMKLSGNYIAPTLNGEWYYNKPPLFNWILLGYFNLFGVWEEWVPRLATVVSLLGYGATIFYFFRKHYTTRLAWIVALSFITCGRVLLWDSQLGLIDITFSWVTFLSFMVVYHAYEKQRWWTLFLVSYTLAAAGFMMKGLPSVVFQGLTLLVYFGYRRAWSRFFSLAHVAGGLLFLTLLGLYYWQYSHYHTLAEIFPTLLDESSKRTAVQYGWGDTVVHFLTFPFEMIYHFFPWSLGILFIFHRKIWNWLREDAFTFYLALIFLANILLYWTSVGVYPRYLLMHAPLLFGVFFYLQEKHVGEWTLVYRVLEWIWGGFLGLLWVAAFLPFFWARAQWVDGYYWKSALLVLLLSSLLLAFWKWRTDRVLVVLVAMLVLRLGFDWFVLPDRHREDWGTRCKESTIQMAQQLKEAPNLYIYKNTALQYTNSFYLTAVRQQLLERRFEGFQPGDYIIVDPETYPSAEWDPVGEFFMRFDKKRLQTGRIREPVEKREE